MTLEFREGGDSADKVDRELVQKLTEEAARRKHGNLMADRREVIASTLETHGFNSPEKKGMWGPYYKAISQGFDRALKSIEQEEHAKQEPFRELEELRRKEKLAADARGMIDNALQRADGYKENPDTYADDDRAV